MDSVTLAYPFPDKSFILDTDASDTTIGAELLQVHDDKEFVVSYASKVLSPAQRRYCTTRKELLAVVTFTRQFRNYLLGRQFTVRTDHNSLTWLLRFKAIEGQLARWLEELSQYDMVIQHRSGKKQVNADSLSRLPDVLDNCDYYFAGANIDSLPCGGCLYCIRAQRTWSTFENDVDDVVPLSVRTVTDFQSEESCNWLEAWNSEEISLKQKTDKELKRIRVWLEKGDPSEHELQLSSSAIKYLWNCRSQLLLKNNILLYHWTDTSQSRYLLVVPLSLRKKVIFNCHDSKASGHFGQNKTVSRLKQRFIWHGMRQDVLNCVRTCQICNTNKKANKKARGPLGQFHAGAPLERVHIDILGPLVESRIGNKYILVLIDQFTKWVAFYALPNQNALFHIKIWVPKHDSFRSRTKFCWKYI